MSLSFLLRVSRGKIFDVSESIKKNGKVPSSLARLFEVSLREGMGKGLEHTQ